MNDTDMLPGSCRVLKKIYGLYGLKHHIVEMRGGVTDAGRTTERQTLKIELLSQWKLAAEFRNSAIYDVLIYLHLVFITRVMLKH